MFTHRGIGKRVILDFSFKMPHWNIAYGCNNYVVTMGRPRTSFEMACEDSKNQHTSQRGFSAITLKLPDSLNAQVLVVRIYEAGLC